MYSNQEIQVLQSLSVFHLNYFNYFSSSEYSNKIEIFTKNIYLITENIIYINTNKAIDTISLFTRNCFIKTIDYTNFNNTLIVFIKMISKSQNTSPEDIQFKLEENRVFTSIRNGDVKKFTKQLSTIF